MKTTKRTLLVGLLLALLAQPALGAAEEGAAEKSSNNRCPNGRSHQLAMWLSIAHPGVGEYYLKGWGDWSKMPQNKFWYGWIPLYGWPGYLQVKSADDAFHCNTTDRLKYDDAKTRSAGANATASRR